MGNPVIDNINGYPVCGSMYGVCPTSTETKIKVVAFYPNTSVDDGSPAYLRAGMSFFVLFYNAVKGMTYLNAPGAGNVQVVNGVFADYNENTRVKFVMYDNHSCYIVEAYPKPLINVNNSYNLYRTTTVTVNEATVGGSGNSIAKNGYMAGVKTYGATNTTSTTTGTTTYSTALISPDYGFYPVGVAGFDSTSRHYHITRAYINNIVQCNDSGVASSTGWYYKCDLNWMLYNPYTSASTGIVTIHILWAYT